MNWLVVYVKSRTEKKVAERLRNKGFDVFCPLNSVKRKWSDRLKIVDFPFFPSYVFVRCDLEDRIKVLATPGIVNFVHWLNKPAIIKDKEMQSVIDFFKKYKDSEIFSQSFESGDEVFIVNGLFSDIKGVVLKKTKHQVTLEVKQLGLGFKVLVPTENIQKITK